MGLTFEKAPLVEIIAELRWAPPLPPGPSGGQPGAIQVPVSWLGSSAMDEFYMRFAGEVYQSGFQRMERVVPPSFPTPPFTVVCRYRKDTSVLYQTGPGLFSANAVPPYKSWDEFSPVVEAGIAALIKTRADPERDQPFSGVSLRYINGFTQEFLLGRSPSAFITEVLGFRLAPPNAVARIVAQGATITPSVQLQVPVSKELAASVSVGEGTINGVPGVVLDTLVSATEAIAPEAQAAMRTFNQARTLIHRVFVEMTQPLHALMRPQGEESI